MKLLRQWLHPLQDDLPPLYLVGGAVRDHLLSRAPKDIDLICTDAKAVAKKLAAVRNATMVPFEKKADEPCFRVVDRRQPGNFLDISPMRGGTLNTDLCRRDFTINAIAIRIAPDGTLGELADPMKGADDLKRGCIRMTGPDVFRSDPLRILRAIRFAASLGFDIETDTLAVIATHVDQLTEVASERILVELLEIFKTRHSATFVRKMDELRILEVIFPEIRPMKGCAQNAYHHLDVWNHSLLVVDHCEDILNHLEYFFGPVSEQVRNNLRDHRRMPLLKFAAMLHDVGKPVARGFREDTGRITFYGHDRQGAEIMSEITRRLRMSRRDQEFLNLMVAEHLHILNLFFHKVKPATRMRWFRKLRDDCIPLLIMGMADIKSALGPMTAEERRDQHLRWSAETVGTYFNKIKEKLERQDLINGRDLIEQGISPGPEMGRILRSVRDAQDAGYVRNRKEALALAKRRGYIMELPKEFRLISKFVTGSHLYGTNTPASDVDTRGVFIPGKKYFLGFLNRTQQFEDKVNDVVFMEIRQYLKLALDCNPNIIEWLFVPEKDWLASSKEWERIVENRELFLSKKARYTFAGYAFSQLKRIQRHRSWLLHPPGEKPLREDYGLPGQKKLVSADQMGAFNAILSNYFEEIKQHHALKAQLEEMQETRDFMSVFQSSRTMNVKMAEKIMPVSDNFLEALDKEKRYNQALQTWNQYQDWKKKRNPERAELERRYGFDTKHGSHLYRLLGECEEMLTEKTLTFPRPDAELLLDIRNGCWDYDRLMTEIGDIDARFDKMYEESTLPKKPNRVKVDQFCIEIVETHLKAERAQVRS
ncbi:MAG: hypothetical protein B6245_04710 [Desulfobacteraceae bacterium 4572_88]|nr:MAG: hypothetical protein B6245_04710 [Desulfobacteraceae bacterium 4572_88]